MATEPPTSEDSPQTPRELEFTWDLGSIFPDTAGWEQEYQSVQGELAQLASFKGRLLESSEVLHAYLVQAGKFDERCGRLYAYAYLSYYGDTNDEAARILLDRAEQLIADGGAARAFFNPEILSAAPGCVSTLIEGHPPLAVYRHLFEEIERWRPHMRSEEVEAVLGTVSPVSSLPEAIRTSLHDAEMRFEAVRVGDELREVTHGTIDELLSNPDREVRRAAYESYTDGYLKFPRTLGQAIGARAKTALVFSKVRAFESTFDAAMFAEGFSGEIFHGVLQACHDHRPLFQRYFKARAALLGGPKLAEYDLLAPLSAAAPSFPYEKGREVVLASLEPLGEEYVSVARRGLFEERWADVYPRPGKYSNAFSGGSYGTRPFLLLNFAPTMPEVGVVAHELGHSMHSHITNTHQPVCYASYAMSVAETASNLNQVLLRAHLLREGDRETTLSVLEEAFYFAHRYLFLMPTLSQVEHKLHTTYAAGGAMSASDLSEATLTAFRDAYGDAVEIDPERVGIKWAKFCHFYVPYYFFQYAIGISAAMSIGKRILDGESGAREAYLEFLAAGGSKRPAELFQIIDVDIASPKSYKVAFAVVEGYVETLERVAAER